MFAGMIAKMAAKLMTEAFLSKLIIKSMYEAAKKSSNELDDKLVRDAAQALNVKL